MHFLRIYISLLFLLLLVFSESCKPSPSDYDKEKVYLDSLEKKTNYISKSLSSNIAKDLNNRIALINTWYVSLKDTSYDVATKRRVEFNGFKVIYQKYIDNFYVYQSENEVLKQQLSELRNEAKNESITRQKFKTKYKELKASIDTLRSKTVSIIEPINDLAFSWKRYYEEKQ